MLLSGSAGAVPALAHEKSPRDAAGGRAVPQAEAPQGEGSSFPSGCPACSAAQAARILRRSV